MRKIRAFCLKRSVSFFIRNQNIFFALVKKPLEGSTLFIQVFADTAIFRHHLFLIICWDKTRKKSCTISFCKQFLKARITRKKPPKKQLLISLIGICYTEWSRFSERPVSRVLIKWSLIPYEEEGHLFMPSAKKIMLNAIPKLWFSFQKLHQKVSQRLRQNFCPDV